MKLYFKHKVIIIHVKIVYMTFKKKLMLIYPNGFKIIIIHTCKLLNLEVQLCDACVKSCDLTIIAWDQTQTLIWKWVNIFIFI